MSIQHTLKRLTFSFDSEGKLNTQVQGSLVIHCGNGNLKALTYTSSSDPRLNHKMQKKTYYYSYVSQAKSKKMNLAQEQSWS